MLAAAISIPVAAHADTDNFVVVGGGSTLSFSLPASPVPSYEYYYNGTLFSFQVADVTVYDSAGPTVSDTITFDSDYARGGFFDSLRLINAYGPQLFTNSGIAPTFALGSYQLDYPATGPEIFYQLTISPAPAGAPSPIPEPSTLLLLGTGMAGLAGAVRRRLV